MSTIYYFSGTGNSLYFSKKLRDLCTYELVDISTVREGTVINGKCGFIFPIYGQGVPRVVLNFLENSTFEDINYLFSIITCGGKNSGQAQFQIDEILKEKNIKLNYFNFLHMPDNYIKMFKPKNLEEAKVDISESQNKIIKIAGDINGEVQWLENRGRSTFDKFLYKFWRWGLTRDIHKKFKVNNNCVHCSICKKVCPVDNIEMIDGLPKWNNKCEDCLACVNLCPKKAITCGGRSTKGDRYKNPFITTEELFR